MTTIAFFAHDEKDAAIRRRVESFQKGGHNIIGFAMRRGERAELGWNEIDLGRTYDANYTQRLKAIFHAARRAAAARERLAQADLVYARNLDTALSAQAAMKMAGVKRPFVYECLDIHRLMHRKDAVGVLMRRLERLVLSNSNLLVVSSPAFLRDYFDIHHPRHVAARLIENRILDHPALGMRPSGPANLSKPLRIGWFGVLRCERSLRVVESLAERFKGRVEIVMAGYPDLNLSNYHERVRRHFNMRYTGRYKSPEDLAGLYNGADLVWAGDFHDAGYNSRWLLPNRLYEGGYFATPAIAPAGTETANWIENRNAGFVIAEDIEQSLPEFIERALASPGLVAAARNALLSAPVSTFVQPASEMSEILQAAMASCEPSHAGETQGLAQTRA